jgi:hypothetical protein
MARDEPATAELDGEIEAFKRDLDRTLFRENLKLTVEQRLRNLMAWQAAVDELRRAGFAARARKV